MISIRTMHNKHPTFELWLKANIETMLDEWGGVTVPFIQEEYRSELHFVRNTPTKSVVRQKLDNMLRGPNHQHPIIEPPSVPNALAIEHWIVNNTDLDRWSDGAWRVKNVEMKCTGRGTKDKLTVIEPLVS